MKSSGICMDPSWQDWQLVWIIWNGMIILEAFFTWKNRTGNGGASENMGKRQADGERI